MSLVEGSGVFKCAHESHQKEFVTTDIKKFNEHIAKGDHTYYGVAPCAVCDTPVKFDLLPVCKKPVCAKCKKELS